MRSEVQVLLDPPLNIVASGVAYLFGALAQLGERLICIQEVSGSIPLGSTKSRCIKSTALELVHRFDH